jgi:hypothetical protein
MEVAMKIRCCVCKGFATTIVYDGGWHKPSCLTCWPRIDIPKLDDNHPTTGVLVYL